MTYAPGVTLDAPQPWTPPAGPRRSLAEALRAGGLLRASLVGTWLGPYAIEGELGRGGMGAVLRARHGETGAVVALKVMLAGAQASDAQRRRFLREATLAAGLAHPSIVAVRDAGEADGLLYLALELIEGRTLAEVLDEGLAPRRLAELLLEVADAVGAAHAAGVVHRDLKPANVLVRAADGRALVTDFGLARDTAVASSLTKTGGIVGTPDYMAPEQIHGRPPTPATDVFALGAILYEGLTGQAPFTAPNVALRLGRIAGGDLEPPRALTPEAPRALERLCLRALAAEPAARPQDAAAFAGELRAFLAGGEAGGRPRRLALVAALGVALLASGGALALLWGGSPPDGAPSAASAVGGAPAPPAPAPTPTFADVLAASAPAERLARARALLAREPDHAEAAALAADLAPWVERRPATSPPARDGHHRAMVYAPELGGVLLHGGFTGWGGVRHDDLWVWDGTSWRELAAHGRGPHPVARQAHAASYDRARRRLTVFGGNAGRDQLTALMDTWEWDGERWHERTPWGDNPAHRLWAGFAYDADRRVGVLFGGHLRSRRPTGDLWEWDGETWRRADGGSRGPSPRWDHVWVYDEVRREVVLYGGFDGERQVGDMWTWDGSSWHEIPGPHGPGARAAAAAVSAGGRLLLHGGTRAGGFLGDTWLWDGERWTERHPVAAPGPRAYHAMAYDAARGVAVLFGGGGKRRAKKLGDTWELRLEPEADPAAASEEPR